MRKITSVLQTWQQLNQIIQEQLMLYVIGYETGLLWSFCLHGKKCIIRILKCSNLNTLRKKRFFSKNNYLIQTDAVKNYLIPVCNYREDLQWLPYAEEADLLNVALFGFTAKAWRDANPELAKNSNVRDYATINELTVLSNLESHNAQMIREGKSKADRFEILKEIAEYQIRILNEAENISKQIEDGGRIRP